MILRVPTHDPATWLTIPGRTESIGNDLSIVREIWCEDVYRVHEKLRTNDPIRVVDCGAAFGAFTVLALRLAPAAMVLAVEPSPDQLAVLRANLTEHDPAGRCVVRDLAVSDFDGEALLSADGGRSRLGDTGAPVRVAPLASVLLDFRGCDIDILKVDVEGHECRALSSVPREVMQRIRYVAAEVDEESRDMGALVTKLSETHKVRTLGSWDRGGYVWAEAY